MEIMHSSLTVNCDSWTRLRRIQQHRDSGMLLQFSPTNRETVPRPMMIDKPSEWPDPATLTSVEVPERSLADSTNTSNLTEPHENSTNFDPNICDILEKMHGQLNEFIGRNQSAELQAQVLRVQELVAENSDLKKARNILENKIEHVMDVHAAERNDFLTQVACLSSKLEATQQSSESQLKAWDETRAILKHQVDMLAQEKENLGLKINRCENDLKDSREKLQLTTKLLEDAKKEKDLEKTLLEDKIKENELLVATIQKELIERENQCSALKRELEAAKNLSVKLQGEITTYIKEIDSMGSTVDIYKKCESDLRRQNDALQNAVNSLECELNQSKIAMINEKDSKIGELFKQLGDLQEILSRERGQWTLSLNSAEEKERNLLKQVDGLQQSLSAASDRVKDLEATNSSMEEELNDQKEEALRQLRAIDVMKLESQKIKSDLELQVGDLCKALVETTNRVNLLSAENKSLHDQLAQASIQITDRQHQYEHLESVTKSEIDRLTQELNDVCKELEETEHKYTDAQSRLKELSCENIQSQASSSATLASLDHTEQLLMAERLRCEKSEERIIDLQRQLRSVCQERDDARTNMKDFTEREEELYAKLRASEQIRREMHGKIMQLMGNIRVFVRVRPCLPGESKVERSINDCVDVFDTPFQYPQLYELRDDLVCGNHDATKNRIKVREPFKDRGGLNDRRKVWEYSFDKVFSPDHTQDDIWESTEPLVQSTIDGYNVTIFAYGQTGSGKTYTMLGEPENEGIITRSIKKLFRAKNEIEALSRGKTKVEVAVELLEVYNEKVRDLVAPNSGPRGSEIPVKVTSQEVVGNTMVQTTTEEQVFHILNLAQGRRCVKATLSNSESSRSHMIFTIHFNVCMLDGSLRRGKLNVCDLAGSERLSKSKTNEVGVSKFFCDRMIVK